MNHERARILILGVGNILLSDEGVGVRAVEELEKTYAFPDEVELLDGGTSGMELISHIESREHLWIIDAVKQEGLQPGDTLRMDLDDPPAYFQQKITPHQLGLSDVLAAASLTDCLPEHIRLYGIVPESLATGIDLTETASRGMEAITDRILSDLQKMGIESRAKVHSSKFL